MTLKMEGGWGGQGSAAPHLLRNFFATSPPLSYATEKLFFAMLTFLRYATPSKLRHTLKATPQPIWLRLTLLRYLTSHDKFPGYYGNTVIIYLINFIWMSLNY